MDAPRKRLFDERAQAIAAEAAKQADAALGRKDPDAGDLAGIEVASVVPEHIRETPAFKTVNQGVATASVGLAVVALIFGNGTFSAVVAGVSVAANNSTTFGSYLGFFAAFALTLPLSILVSTTSWAALAGHVQSWGAVMICSGGAVFIAYVARNIGIDGPTWEQLLTSGSDPGQRAIGILQAYLEYYTIIPFAGGVITGLTIGWIAFRLSREHA